MRREFAQIRRDIDALKTSRAPIDAASVVGQVTPQLDVSLATGLPDPGETSDGLPPQASPAPVVVPMFGQLAVTIPKVENADPVTVDLFVTSQTVQQQATVPTTGTPLASIPMGGGPYLLVVPQADGAALDPSRIYRFVTVARDADGPATGGPSAEASGSPVARLDEGQVAQSILDGIDAAGAAADQAQAAADAAAQAAQQAAQDATSKSAASQSAAIAAAASDATSKANAAQSAATSAAASDAASKVAANGRVIIQVSAPTGANAVPQNTWIDISGTPPKNRPNRYDSGSSSWVPITDKTATDAAAAAVAAQTAANAATAAASTAQATADGKNTSTISGANPPAGSVAGARTGDTWRKVTGGVIKAQWTYDGSQYQPSTIDGAVLTNLDAGSITTGFLNVAVLLQAGAITGDKIAANSISTDQLDANAITAAMLIANDAVFQAVQAVGIEIGASYWNEDNGFHMAAGSNASFDKVTINNLFAMYGTQNSLFGDLVAAQGVVDPTDPPNAVLGWQTLTVTSTFPRGPSRGMCDDSANNRWLTCAARATNSAGTDAYLYAIDKTTGSVTSFAVDLHLLPGYFNDGVAPYAVAKYNGRFYVLWYSSGANNAHKGWGISDFSSTFSAPGYSADVWVDQDEEDNAYGATLFYGAATLAIDANGYYITGCSKDAFGDWYTLSFQCNSDTTIKVKWHSSAPPNNVPCFGSYVGNADYGARRLVVFKGAVPESYSIGTSTTNPGKYDSMSKQSAEAWPYPGSGVIGGCMGDDGRFASFDGSKIYRYDNNRSGANGTATDYEYSWTDSDSSGVGVAETKPSPPKSVVVNRHRVAFSLPRNPPDDGTADGANTATVYARVGTAPFRVQEVLPEGTVARTYTTPPVTNVTGVSGNTGPATTSGFTGSRGGMGRHRSIASDSLGPLWFRRGDGTWRDAQTQIALRAASSNADQSLPSTPAQQVLFGDTPPYNYGAWNVSGSTITIPTDGVYEIACYVLISSNATGRRYLFVESYTGSTAFGTGTNVIRDDRAPVNGAATGMFAYTAGEYLTAGTKLRVGIFQNSGAALTIANSTQVARLTVRKVGAS